MPSPEPIAPAGGPTLAPVATAHALAVRPGVEVPPRVFLWIVEAADAARTGKGARREASRAALAEVVRLCGDALKAARAVLRAESEAGRVASADGSKGGA